MKYMRTTPIDIIKNCKITNDEQQKVIDIEKKYSNYDSIINIFSFLLLMLDKIIIEILINKYLDKTNYIIEKNCLILTILLWTRCIIICYVNCSIQHKLSSEWNMLYANVCSYTLISPVGMSIAMLYFILNEINDILYQQLFLLGVLIFFESMIILSKIIKGCFIMDLIDKINERITENINAV